MSTSKKVARAVADLSRGVILAVVEIEVPPERVFRALTDPEEVVRWWGSDDTYHVTESKIDLRVGGQWSSRGRGGDGATFTVRGEFLEIDPPRRLVQTWKPDWDGGHTTTIHYLLDATAAGTRVTVRHEGFGDRAQSCDGHAQGWERVLGWLVGHVAAPAPAPPKSFFLCRLLAPRPTFAFDMTPEERAIMQEHGAYWRTLLREGSAVVFGPVADPKGAWGLGVIRAADEAEVRRLESQDPVILSRRGFSYEVLPMLTAVYKE
jgi:uncharacterized protein YndB with AHSA1/START domain